MISKEDFNTYQTIKEQVEEYALTVAEFVRDNDLRLNVTFKGTSERIEIGSTDVDIKFSESWAYGGYDSYEINYPSKFLLMTINEIKDLLEETNEPIRQRRIQSKINADKALLKTQKDQYEKLKKQFE
jgi:hypothetical protein